jgi:hypothetical protein
MGEEEGRDYWRRCAACKREIKFGEIYQICSVSTCRKQVYCSVDCWNEHVPVMNHKSSWAEEEVAPTKDNYLASADSERVPKRVIVSSPSDSSKGVTKIPKETLIVVSKLKNYVKAQHDCNTSANVIDILSDYVRSLCDQAAIKARQEGRKTLMDRDFY